MGLGKTLTMIALVALEKETSPFSSASLRTPSLVLVPPPRQCSHLGHILITDYHMKFEANICRLLTLVLDTWEEQLKQ